MTLNGVLCGDSLTKLRRFPDGFFQCCVTSPPYWGLRDYGHAGQIGLEDTPDAYVACMVEVFREVKRVLRDDGTLWLNLGDSYAAARGGTTPPAQTVAGGVNGKGGTKERRGQADGYNPTRDCSRYGLKHKDLVGIPWRVAFALQADGWYLRQDIIWHKPNPMPESCRDRCTKAHEYIFLLSKSPRYYWNRKAMQVPASTSFAKDKRHATGSHTKSSDEAKAASGAQDSHGPHRVFGRSGNKARKDATGRGCPASGVDGNVPWEGMTANRRSVWTVTTRPFRGAHFATFPPDLIRPCILAGCPPDGIVLDPFAGAGTTGVVCKEEGRKFIGIELNPEYVKMANDRIAGGEGKA